ncbi:unnamed protein product [Haemonchus placei]|uniref:C6 domain-containing protein n=1 Tax=Haemonchus placei TaxID=6290 RepID=A0A0N4WGQ5_HAEPC|nr:unnamed protein product [Haemonchus placei]
MPWPFTVFLIASAILLAQADVSKVFIVQNFNLKSAVATDITCGSIKKIMVQNIAVNNYTCTGETLSKGNETGMYIVTEMQAIATPSSKKLTWFIEYSGGNLTSTINIEDVLDKTLTAASIVQISEPKAHAQLVVKNDDAEETTEKPNTTEAVTTTEKPHEPTTTTTQAPSTSPKAPSPINVTVAVSYIQFQTGQAPIYENKHTAAVVFAVIEVTVHCDGFVACSDPLRVHYAMLQKVIFKSCWHVSDSRHWQYTRPEIPSYRAPDTQPPVRLDSLSPRAPQPVITPNLMPVSTTQPTSTTPAVVTPAPLDYWPDQPRPVKNIIDSDI